MLLITFNYLNINMFAQAILARVLKNTELRLIRTWLETGSFLTKGIPLTIFFIAGTHSRVINMQGSFKLQVYCA